MTRTRRQHFGQHFLHHDPTIRKILDNVEKEISLLTDEPKCIIEVGPGKLAITHGLSKITQKQNLPLILIEKDLKLEKEIRSDLNKDFELHFMDAANEDFSKFIMKLKKESRTPFYFVSNLPYSAGSQILANLCHHSDLISGATVMVQKDFAERMIALTPKGKQSDRGSFSVLIESYFHSKIEFDVGPGAFTPPPKVMSSVLTLRPKPIQPFNNLKTALQFEKFVKAAFSQRRKMIRTLVPEDKRDELKEIGLTGTERPENLNLENWYSFFKICSSKN